MTPGWHVSPLGTAHLLDESGVAMCGRYSPEKHDRRRASPDASKCPRCVLLMPRVELPGKDHHSPKETRDRNQAIRDARKADPEVTIEALAERYDCTQRLVRLALKRIPTSKRFAAEAWP